MLISSPKRYKFIILSISKYQLYCFQACFGSLSPLIFHFSLVTSHAWSMIISMKNCCYANWVPPPNIFRVVLLRDPFVFSLFSFIFSCIL